MRACRELLIESGERTRWGPAAFGPATQPRAAVARLQPCFRNSRLAGYVDSLQDIIYVQQRLGMVLKRAQCLPRHGRAGLRDARSGGSAVTGWRWKEWLSCVARGDCHDLSFKALVANTGAVTGVERRRAAALLASWRAPRAVLLRELILWRRRWLRTAAPVDAADAAPRRPSIVCRCATCSAVSAARKQEETLAMVESYSTIPRA